METDAILEARGLVFRYAGAAALSQRCGGHRHTALTDINFSIRRGQRVAVLGANGAGKSTLLLLLNGTLKPAAGGVRIDGQPAAYTRAGLQRWRQQVGLVFQDPDDQLFAGTVYEDVSYGPANLGLAPDAVRARAMEVLEQLGLAGLADSPLHMLSGGQRKRAAIAGILAMRPEVLILDEPTAGLDAAGADQLLACLDGIAAGGAAVILAAHDTDLALHWADLAIVLAHGRIAGQGDPAAVLGDTARMAACHLRVPWILDCWNGIRAGIPSGAIRPPPRTRAQMLEWLGSGWRPAARS